MSIMNENAGKEMVPVSSALIDILSRSMELSRICQGAFDVTIAPLVETWRIGQSIFSQPEDIAIEKSQQLVSYQDILLDPAHSKAGLKRSGQKIDLGAIGKGYTGDKIIELFKEFGVTSAYSNLGGNVVTLGARPDEELWRIGIQHPRRPGEFIHTLHLQHGSMASSGDYERCIQLDGRRYGHVLNPRTGWPVGYLASVSVVGEFCVVAGSASTIAMLKEEDGPAWLDALGVPHFWVDTEGRTGGNLFHERT